MRSIWIFGAVLWACTAAAATGDSDLVRAGKLVPLAAEKATEATPLNPFSYNTFYIDLPSNVSSLTVSASAGGADVELLVRQGIPHDATSMQGLIDQSAYVSVGANPTEVIEAARSSTPPLTPGRWWLTIANPTDQPITVDLQADFETSGPPFQITPGMSGGWYEPAKSGQGFFFEIINETSAFAVWFTYTPDRKQAYLYGVGAVDGDRVVLTNLFKTSGARFGADFQREDVVLEDWGDLVFTFDGCSSGYASYLPAHEGWSVEQLKLARLTQLAEVPCGSAAPKQSFIGVGMSGAWYETARSGEGLLVEVLSPTVALIYAFTYTPDGEQAWFGGVGTLSDGSLVIPEVRQTVGGVFGPNYDPAEVTHNIWGAMAFTWTGCSNAVGLLYGPPDYGSWNYGNLVRLTQPAGTPACDLRTDPARLLGAGTAPPNTFLDGDVNNPDAPLIPNNTPSETQDITNPALVAGFLTAQPTGNAGDRFADTHDGVDAYTLPLAQGQVLRLSMPDHDAGDPNTIDLDLFLYNHGDTSAPVASSEGVGPVEQIIVPSSGTYDVVLMAYAGGGSYLLSVDSAGTASTQLKGLMSSLTDMIPEQLIVRFDDQGMLPGDTKSLERIADQKLAPYGLKRLSGMAGQPVLVGLVDSSDRARSAKALGVKLEDRLSAMGWRDEGPDRAPKREVVAYSKAIARMRGVRYAEPNGIARALAAPNDPRYGQQWHYPMINLPQAWGTTVGSADVVVAVIDTGVIAHPDLVPNLRMDLGLDSIRNLQSARDGDGPDFDATDPGDLKNNTHSSFHGTHVAGTVAAASNNSQGVAGVAWGSKVMPVRVLGRSGGDLFDIATGIGWAAAATTPSPSKAADVINLSLGGEGACPSLFAEAISAARARNAIVVVAAGNEAIEAHRFTPANCPGSVTVSAVERTGSLASYSNFDYSIDVAAPGGGELQGDYHGVVSTMGDDRSGQIAFNYAGISGTSMAAPHVAGVAALMKSIYPDLTPDQFDSLLASGVITRSLNATPLGTRDFQFGFGLIDAFKAVSEARRLASAAEPPPAPGVLPTALDLGNNLTTATVNLSNLGAGTLSVSQTSTSQSWLSVSPAQTGAGGIGSYTVNVNRTGLVAAAYQGQVRFQTNAGEVAVQVSMRVGETAVRGELGPLYYLLLDPVTYQVVREIKVVGSEGRYAFDFQGVLPGSYVLLVGSDNDNDFVICDAGEACGAYPLLSDPSLIHLVPGTLDLGDFPVLPDTRMLDLNAEATKRRGDLPPISRLPAAR